MARLFARRPHDRPEPALAGWKLAHLLLSADRRSVGFSGITMGRTSVYGPVADAVCGQGGRHTSPSRWCDCGFYCLHEPSDARDLACDPEHRDAVLLRVVASGRYHRHERGLRYSRQRVREVHPGRCRCGHAATLLTESGDGVVGWRHQRPACPGCAGPGPRLDLAALDELLGGVRLVPDTGAPGPSPDELSPGGAVAVLAAELAILQSRFDDLEARLDGRD